MATTSIIQWLGDAPEHITKKIGRYKEVFIANWHLGFTAFGGPPVHFQIFHTKFVTNLQWIDEQTYQELFGISQALPGPASTKMLFSINVLRGGYVAGFMALGLWILPGALAMYGLSLGISRISETLPSPVYALLSGLNAGTVGIILLAAVHLSEKAITDKLSRAIVIGAGAAGMLYTALWYFPVLMVAGGGATLVWDGRWIQNGWKVTFGKKRSEEGVVEEARREEEEAREMERVSSQRQQATNISGRSVQEDGQATQRHVTHATSVRSTSPIEASIDSPSSDGPRPEAHSISWKSGLLILAAFFTSFITIMVLRSILTSPPLGLQLFSNLYLAGTIIFGGGPVVIPLLREYIVAPGWVSARDFLLGLAIIQAFPGPNFNFAVYLGSLTLMGADGGGSGKGAAVGFAGAVIGAIAIFTPGLWIVVGFMSLWQRIRKVRAVGSILRGVNAAAVGLVWTAVYRLASIGYIDEKYERGTSLGVDGWWVAVTGVAFAVGRWWGVGPVGVILGGGVAGLLWYAVVRA